MYVTGASVCNITTDGLSGLMCNANSTNSDSSDDYLTFNLNPTGTNIGTSYNVTVSSGTIMPTSANYGSATSFQLQGSSAGGGNVTVTITDAVATSCMRNVTITDPGQCSACVGAVVIRGSKSNPTSCGANDGKITILDLVASTGYTLNYKKNGTAVAASAITSTASGTYEISGLDAATYTEITVTQTAGSLCISNQIAQTLSDPSAPTVTDPSAQSVCVGDMTAAIIFSGSTGATFNWMNSNTAIGLAASGTGNIAAFTTTNTTSSPISATIIVTPVMGACTGMIQTFTLTVNPLPSISSNLSNPSTCGGSDGKITISGLTASASYSLTYKKDGTAVGPLSIIADGAGNYDIASQTAGAYTEIMVVDGNMCSSNQEVQTLGDPGGSTAATLSVTAATAEICKDGMANLTVAITGGVSPYTVVYSDGTNNFTANNYASGTNISVSPTATTTYSLISVTDASSCIGTGNTGTGTVTVIEITGITMSNVSACIDNNTTNDLTDDTFTADVMVTFTSSPSSGNLVLSGNGTASTVASGLAGTTHTFTGVSMPADGGMISLTASFSGLTSCTFNNTNAGIAPFQCSFTSFAVDNTGGVTNSNDPMFMADDPCTCNRDQVLNADGSVATAGTLSETITVNGPSGLFVRIADNPSNTGFLDGARNPLSLPSVIFTETVTGIGMSSYTFTFNHLDRVGYDVMLFEFSTLDPATNPGTTFSPVTGGGINVTISNVCAYPQVAFSPALASTVTVEDAPITLGASLVGSTPPIFSPTPPMGVSFSGTGVTGNVFNPSVANIGVHAITLNYDIVAGSGMGGVSGNPAIPTDDMNAANGVCPVQILGTIRVDSATIPTMSEWGLLIFGLLTLNMGLIFLRRKEEILEV